MLGLLLFSTVVSAQELSIISNLPDKLKESSGLMHLENRLFTHNDSGDAAVIYEIDKTDGSILGTVEVRGANNVDWEDITYDDSYIYLADIGNNIGSRQDLKIYRIVREDFLNTVDGKVDAEVINIKYKDQTDYTPSPYDTNFDAEALLALEDKLVIFTKNWMNFETDIYSVPKSVGNYELEKMGSINSEGLITSATFDKESDRIVLTGYDEDYAFIATLSNIEDENIATADLERLNLDIPSGNSFQVEAIDMAGEGEFYLSSETGYSGVATLFKFAMSSTLSVYGFENVTDSIFPNPAADYINLKIKNFQNAEIFDVNGKRVLRSNQKKILTSDLPNGVYLLKASSDGGLKVSNYKLIISN